MEKRVSRWTQADTHFCVYLVRLRFPRAVLLQSRIQITGLGDRALEQETYHVVPRLSYQLDHLGRQEVSVLFEETIGLVDHATGEMVYREADRVGFRPHVEL